MTWPAHPDDEWIELTIFGDATPRFMLSSSGAEREVSQAKEQYALDQITLDEFAAVVDRNLKVEK